MLAGVGGVTLLGSTIASNRLEQIYYLGTFDPDNRVPPTFFRLRVRGQASLLSQMKFGSGWVPAAVVDNLSEDASTIGKPALPGATSPLKRPYGAHLQQYGPEGFRTVPDDSRLAIVMGSSPEAFFSLVDQFTASMTAGKSPEATAAPDQVLLKSKLDAVTAERTALDNLKAAYASLIKP